ncbi:hypothetical protein KKH13_05280 [Patescibacteria group bacterium]|uniref:Uncharacterized protein n=1 Tax=viral metagenome TaxID=1070528 RepID=A0A6M3KS98_9ZZZZ|nr:hypothetical protein [Patescibacteria group bacterium]
MSNCVIYIKGSDKIEQFITDAVKINKRSGVIDINGSNGKRTGINPALFDLKWTADTANPVFDENSHQIGYDKRVSDLTGDGENVSITVPDRSTYCRAVKLRARIADMNEQQVIDHVDTVFGGLNKQQQQSLKYLYLAVWGQVQMDNLSR